MAGRDPSLESQLELGEPPSLAPITQEGPDCLRRHGRHFGGDSSRPAAARRLPRGNRQGEPPGNMGRTIGRQRDGHASIRLQRRRFDEARRRRRPAGLRARSGRRACRGHHGRARDDRLSGGDRRVRRGGSDGAAGRDAAQHGGGVALVRVRRRRLVATAAGEWPGEPRLGLLRVRVRRVRDAPAGRLHGLLRAGLSRRRRRRPAAALRPDLRPARDVRSADRDRAWVIRGVGLPLHALPRWTAWLGVVGALAHIALLASFVVSEGFFSLEGQVITALPATLFMWIIGTGIAMLRSHSLGEAELQRQ